MVMPGWMQSLRLLAGLFALSLLLSIVGCHSSVPSLVAAHATSQRTTASASSRSDPRLTAIAHVQSLPLYQQAQTACEKQRYQEAADLLERLAATAGLNDLERGFCQEQRNIS